MTHHLGTSSGAVPDAGDLLMLDAIGSDRFRARFNLDNYAGAAFGGQLLGQALAAARRTAPDWPVSSLTGFFFRPGRLSSPIDYAVERISDGRRFASRQVTAWQDGKRIFGAQGSFQKPEAGASRQCDSASLVPAPETLPTLAEFAADRADRLPQVLRDIFSRPFPIELRPLQPERFLSDPERAFWFRMPGGDAVAELADHQSLLALMADYWLPGAIAAQHAGRDAGYTVTSLNHSMWFHRPVRTDDWLLYRTRSPWAGSGRGLSHGLIFNAEGALAATTMQEALLQPLSALPSCGGATNPLSVTSP